MNNISGHGTKITIASLQTFPLGFNVDQFTDDRDPVDISDDEVAGVIKTYDGDVFTYTKANPVYVSIAVIPGSQDDKNLRILLAAKRAVSQISVFNDLTTMVISYPNGNKVVFAKGSILTGPPADSITSQGRRKGNVYRFVFSAYNETQNPATLIPDALAGLSSLTRFL